MIQFLLFLQICLTFCLNIYINIFGSARERVNLRIRKVLIAALSIASMGIISLKVNAAGVPEGYENANTTEVGSSVNIITNGLNSSKTTIFTDDYRLKLQEKSLINCKKKNSATEIYIASTNKKTIDNYITASMKNSLGAKGNIDGVDISASTSIIKNEDITSKTVTSSVYVYYGNYNCKYELVINNDDLISSAIKDNNGYSSTFYNGLASLRNNESYESYVNFFDNFGTHILSDVLMGGKLEMTATYCSVSYSYSKAQVTDIKNSLSASISNYMLNNKMETSVSSSNNLTETTDYYMVKANSIGGSSNYLIDFELNQNKKSTTSNYKEWTKTLDDYSQSGVIGVGGNGLVPVWDILPAEYSYLKTNMENNFKIYAQNTYKYSDDIYNSLETGIIPRQLVREKQVKVTDSGRVNQQMDQINSNYIDGLLPMQSYKDAGWNKCTITVDLKYKRQDLGDQHFYIYSKRPDSKDLESGVLGHWKNSRDREVWFDKDIELEVELDDVINDQMMIVYSASGKLNDDWFNKMVFVSFKFTK